ncbi:10898_t:CDS:2, partial [Dentiscutata heterogama]
PAVSDCSYPLEAQIKTSQLTQNAGFTVTYNNTYKVVNNLRTNEVYILYCSASAPNVSDIPAPKYFQVPLLNVYSSIRYVNNIASITSPCLRKNIENQSVQNFNWSDTANVDVVFLNPSQATNDNKNVIISIGDDLTPLQKLEWVKFYSLFFDKEADVTRSVEYLQNNYQCNTNNLNYIPIASKKTIAWVSYDPILKQFEVKNDVYHTQIIQDAGAYYFKNPASIVNTTDELHSIIDSAYIVIDESQSISSFDAWQRTFGYYPVQSSVNIPDFITYRRVYRVNKLVNTDGYIDWYESAAARPDIAMQDLIAIQYPTYQPSYNTRWLHKFSDNDSPTILTSSDCKDPNQPQTFGTCSANNFTGDSSSKDGSQSSANNGFNGSKKLSPIAEALIITFSILAGLAGFAVGTWLVLVFRRKHQERFIELKDEPEVQMSNVPEPTKTSV